MRRLVDSGVLKPGVFWDVIWIAGWLACFALPDGLVD